MGARGFNRVAHQGLLVHGEVVEHDDVATVQRWHQHLLDVGVERRIVDRAVEDGRRGQALKAQSRDDRVGLPVAAGRVVVQPGAAGAATVAPQQVGGDAALVEEDVLPDIPQRLPPLPLPARGRDVRASLLVGVDRFF